MGSKKVKVVLPHLGTPEYDNLQPITLAYVLVAYLLMFINPGVASHSPTGASTSASCPKYIAPSSSVHILMPHVARRRVTKTEKASAAEVSLEDSRNKLFVSSSLASRLCVVTCSCPSTPNKSIAAGKNDAKMPSVEADDNECYPVVFVTFLDFQVETRLTLKFSFCCSSLVKFSCKNKFAELMAAASRAGSPVCIKAEPQVLDDRFVLPFSHILCFNAGHSPVICDLRKASPIKKKTWNHLVVSDDENLSESTLCMSDSFPLSCLLILLPGCSRLLMP